MTLLEACDAQLRREAEVLSATDVSFDGPLVRGRFERGGFVSYRDLDGIAGDALDELIARTIAHFRDDTDVDEFEWKTRGHDAPADLAERLVAAGLRAEPEETVMIGDATALAVPVEIPAEVTLRRLVLATHPHVEEWVAEVDGVVVATGRLEVVAGTEFAGLWGGATLEPWRGRGIYRAMVAARAFSAIDRGVRYLQSDCTEMSRPILERSGMSRVTTTTPYVWQRSATDG
ncbi:MAG: GNAT family N-acetyltransferase [Nocardioides sp.]|uniref:GNAT family N-acetyltransferase n=1 Tax=Nocardioides sp. TaxID=35761 RepID=UPI0032666F9D